MSNLKNFYEKLSTDEELQARIRELAPEYEKRVKDEMVQLYLKVAQERGIPLEKADFEIKPGMLGVSSGCIIIDNGCTGFGEIDKHGGCFVIGMR